VLYLVDHPSELAKSHGLTNEAFATKLAAINAAMLEARATRDQPLTDDKVITSWNGLMIGGLADAGRVLGEPTWIARAKLAADFINSEMRSDDGKLLRTWRNGIKGSDGFLEDYAALIRGLLSLYVASGDMGTLETAIELYAQAKARFFVEGEGWYDTEEDQSDLFVRTRAYSDGAVPAATSMMLDSLVTLSELTGEPEYLDAAVGATKFESGVMQRSPTAVIVATGAFHRLLSAHPERFNEEFEVSPANPSPIRMTASRSTLPLAIGESKTFTLRLQMAKGWHVNSNRPEYQYAVPLAISLLGEGVSLSVAWPESEQITTAGESVRVYGGTVEIPVTITATGKSDAQIMVTWQACNAELCLASETSQVPCNIIVK